MKKIILLAALALGINFASQAADTDPNRMLVVNSNTSISAYNIQNVDHLEFATVEGEVAANITLKNFSMDKINAEVMRTPSCKSYLFNVLPGVLAHQLEKNPEGAGAYLRQMNAQTYYEDFTNAEVTGMDLEYNTEYALVTLGIDEYNVDCEVRAAYFTTEKANIVGNPQVDVTVTGTDFTTIDLNFAPNSDVKSYWYVLGEKGSMMQQYEQFAAMFGFSNIGQMVKAWGIETTGASTKQYTNLNPNTEYELYVQSADANGNMPDVQIFNMATKKKGGSGEAKVDILISDYGLSDWEGEQKGTQVVTYTPNDQTWAYRCGVYFAEQYEAEQEAILKDLASEPPMPSMAFWFQYDIFTNEYMIDPNTTCVAVAIAKNADGVWGPASTVRFTTPATAEAPASTQTRIAARHAAKAIMGNRPGFITPRAAGIRLVQK